MHPVLRAIVALSVALAWGCSYSLVDRGGAPVTVALPTLANDSLEAGIELMLGAAMRREFEHSGRFRLVEGPRDGAYAIRGRVTRVDTIGRTFTPEVRALEYTVSIQLDLAVTGPAGEPVAIDPFAQHAVEIYLASSDVELGRKNRDEALRRLAGMLAARIRRELERAVARAQATDPDHGAAATSLDVREDLGT